MFGPTGGIWVPIGNFTWTIVMAAAFDGTSWGISYSSPTATTSYSASTTFPTWAESNYYLWSNYGKFVQIVPY